jgi:hypothetical protein
MGTIIDWLLALAVVVALISIWAVAGLGDYEEAVRHQQQYCEMVEIYHESGGEYGWPPYQGEDQC